MKIIVIGAGKVGYTLAEHLTSEEHDVTAIHNSDEVIDRWAGSRDDIGRTGNGANAKILLEAGVDKANIVIASTESDESNMLACLIAKRLGAQYTIARIRDPEFNESQMLLQKEPLPLKSAGFFVILLPAALNHLPKDLLKWLNSEHRKLIR